MRKTGIVIIVFLILTACQPVQTLVPLSTQQPTPTLALTPTQTSTATIEPTRQLTAADLVPMYKVGNTADLTEADLLPNVDIMTDAEQQLRDLGFGEEMDRITEELDNWFNGVFNYTHTITPVYALNMASAQPVYAIFLYDQTCDCLLYPSLVTGDGTSVTEAHSGDISELETLLSQDPNASIVFKTLTIPAGITTAEGLRLIATKKGIVPGFYSGGMLMGWFDFEKGLWHITLLAQTLLENDSSVLNVEEGLEINLDDWLTGAMVIPESVIFDQNASHKMKFNYYKKDEDPSETGFGNYYGVLLGSKVIDDNLFLFMGFEDAASTMYYLPINMGGIDSEKCGTIFGTVASNLGEFHYYLDQSTYYQCKNLEMILRYYIDQPVIISQYINPWQETPALNHDQSLQDVYAAQEDYARSLANFIYNSAFSPIGSDDFNGLINPLPGSATAESYPISFIAAIQVKE